MACFVCSKVYLTKIKLKQHYTVGHGYDPKRASEKEICEEAPKKDRAVAGASGVRDLMSCCGEKFHNWHARIKHQLDLHSRISGDICPYCDNKWVWRKYVDLDSHVSKYHPGKMSSKVQTCRSVKTLENRILWCTS